MQTTTHLLPTGREHTFEGEHLYSVRLTRLAGPPPLRPHEEAWPEETETAVIAADHERSAQTRMMAIMKMRISGQEVQYQVEALS